LPWPSCRSGGQVGSFASGVPVGVDPDGVEVGAVEGLGVCRCLLGDPGQVVSWLSGAPGELACWNVCSEQGLTGSMELGCYVPFMGGIQCRR
jgi:hypothetical protein